MRNPGLLIGTAAFGLLAAILAAPSPAGAADGHPKVALCHGKRATIVGTRHDDRLVGTGGRDVIVGLGGDDRIIAKGGEDWICGKAGFDRLFPGSGDDHVEGGQGGDTTHYSAGDDVIDGGLGTTDTVDYGAARSRVLIDASKRMATFGNSERDRFEGLEYYLLTRYADRFQGGGADASVYAGRGADVVIGGHGNDFFDGGPGDDRLDGGRGLDNLKGDVGADRITDLHGRGYIWDGAPKHFDSGYGSIRTGLSADHYILYPGRYNVDTGGGDDGLTLRGKLANSEILTGAGDDEVLFRRPPESGHLTLRLQDGDDKVVCTAIACGGASDLHGGAGVNGIEFWEGTPAVTAVLGHSGSVVIHSDPVRTMSILDFASIATGGGSDAITGSDAAETFVTGDGDDTVDALGGDDYIAAGSGTDTADAGDGVDQCYAVEHPTSCETVG